MTAESLTLYFQLRPGEKADLEVVAASAIAWVEALRASARAIDPEAYLRVELVDADEASLSLNTLLQWFENYIEAPLERLERGGKRLPRTRKLAIALAGFIVITGVPTYDFYFGEDEFTAEDRAKLDSLLEIARDDPGVQAARRKFYRTIERDPAITGVGVKESAAEQPVAIVPSTLFAEGGGLWESAEPELEPRTSRPILDVILVRPTLVHTPRAWTFKIDGLPEFDAVMRDPAVLTAIAEGNYIGMREGIPMKVQLEVREVYVDGEWRQIRGGRSVVKVLSQGGG